MAIVQTTMEDQRWAKEKSNPPAALPAKDRAGEEAADWLKALSGSFAGITAGEFV
jgi:hypothetical protein